MDFPRLVTSLTPLTEAAGLQHLKLQSEYCSRYGFRYYADAFRGAAALNLLFCVPAATEAELEHLVTDALLDQLAAYYVCVPQL